MKIGVLGTCQASSIGLALQQMMENHQVHAVEAVVAHRENLLEEAADILLACDVLFSHPLSGEFGPLCTSALSQRHNNIRMIPAIAFTGFHPDCVYILDGQTPLRSPMEDYHSAIIAAAFSLGADVEATLRQFNGEVFGKLGYFDEFAKARTFLHQVMTSSGLDLASEWQQLMVRAPFMHTINHPKGFASASLAKLLAVNAGLLPAASRPIEPTYDLLSLSPVWPWYPELAERFGMQGSYLFKRTGAPDVATGQGAFMTVRELVERSFAVYAGFQPDAFSFHTVERVRRILRTTL